MTPNVIENHWANPATPVKRQYKSAQRGITKKGRVIQGEKGIGRFALLKLGRTITLTTRDKRSSSEQLLTLDVSAYNTDFIDEDERALFLDDVNLASREIRQPQQIHPYSMELGVRHTRRTHTGTRHEISQLTTTDKA